MIRSIALICALSLSACSVAQDTADQLARDRAKTAINGVVAEKFPGLNAAPITDCIVDAASAHELLRIAGAGVVGGTAGTTDLILEIAQRTSAVQCIAQAQLAAFL